MTFAPWSLFAQDIADMRAAITREHEDTLRADAEWQLELMREAEAERKANEEEE